MSYFSALIAVLRQTLFQAVVAFGVLLLVIAAGGESRAADSEDEAGAGFFQYFPAPKDIKLPSLDIIPFWTDDLKKARKAYNRGNFDRALKFFRKESEDGSPVADWYLGHMYRLGQGVSRDPAISYSYYERASAGYFPEDPDPKRLRIAIDSQLRMADFERQGIPSAGMKPDPVKAYRTYLRIASSYGHPAAHFALGVMNITGEGVKKNPAQGLKWLTAAARKRHAEAQAYLGDLYWDGNNVKKSDSRALMWYTLAVETADPNENADIINRYNQMVNQVDEDTKLEAEARAKVWAEQYPASLAKGN